MTALTEERQQSLDALLEELGGFPTPETIVRCMEAIGVDPTTEAGQAAVDAAMAGAWAFDRMTSHLVRLRSLNDERMQLGTEIGRLKRHPYPTSEAEFEAAAWARVTASILAGKQEVVFNFFSVCVQHIRSLLLVLAESVGYQIPQDDLDFLDQFRFLRNHYEHWYSRASPARAARSGYSRSVWPTASTASGVACRPTRRTGSSSSSPRNPSRWPHRRRHQRRLGAGRADRAGDGRGGKSTGTRERPGILRRQPGQANPAAGEHRSGAPDRRGGLRAGPDE